MLKMYKKNIYQGNTIHFWEENWKICNYENAIRFCSIDPLRPLFEKYSKKGSLMLEGGCGIGQYLSFYSSHGRIVIGLDFAQQALKALHRRSCDLMLCAGDVSKLPFGDEIFDLYYSGGVVEHFEDSAEKSLREARRVLKKNGVLLIGVPYFSPLRRLLLPFKKNYWRCVEKSQIERKETGINFYQYAYKTATFKKMLNEVGFGVIKKQGYAVIWGLYDLLGEQSEVQPTENIQQTFDKKSILHNGEEKIHSTLLKRLIVSEDETVPILGLGVKFMRWATANMMMYVCIKLESKLK